MTKKTVPADDGWIAYTVSGTGTPLVLIPGLGGDGNFWRDVAAPLSQDFQTIAIDHRGCGSSSRCLIDYSIRQMAEDTLRVMDALNVARCDLVGHSTGGAIALWLALHHRDRCGRLVLSSSWPGPDAYMARAFDLRLKVLDTLGLEAYQDFVDLMVYPPAWYAEHGAEISARRAGQDIDTEILRRRIRALLAFDARAQLGGIDQECMIVCPMDDLVTPIHLSRQLVAGIRGARLIELPTGGHAAPRIAAGAFTAAIGPFLRNTP